MLPLSASLPSFLPLQAPAFPLPPACLVTRLHRRNRGVGVGWGSPCRWLLSGQAGLGWLSASTAGSGPASRSQAEAGPVCQDCFLQGSHRECWLAEDACLTPRSTRGNPKCWRSPPTKQAGCRASRGESPVTCARIPRAPGWKWPGGWTQSWSGARPCAKISPSGSPLAAEAP